MNLSTKTYVLALVFCFSTFSSLFSANIYIVESRTYHSLHTMDMRWKQIAQQMGHQAIILNQSELDDLANLQNADILIISSGLIALSSQRQQTIIDFVAQGGNAYIQSEYLLTHPGNLLFEKLVDQLEGQFSWDGNSEGDLTPMAITDNNIDPSNAIGSLAYFWYGTYGSGDQQILPFFEYENKNYGFIFCPANPLHGKVITISDQDWIRTFNNPALMSNLLLYLVNNPALSILPDFLINCHENVACDGQTVNFQCMTDESPLPATYQWTVNGIPLPGETATTFSSDQLNHGDVIECIVELTGDCAAFELVSNPILLDEIQPLDELQIEIATEQSTACAGDFISFEAITHGHDQATNIRYRWFVNGNLLPGEESGTYTSNQLNDQDRVKVKMIYDDPCATDIVIFSNEIALHISELVTPTATIVSDQQTICFGKPATFHLTGNHWGASPLFDWKVDGQSISENQPTFTSSNLQNGQSLQCIISSSIDCVTETVTATQIISLDVLPAFEPALAIDPSDYSICEGEAVSFMAIGLDFGDTPSFQWFVNGQLSGNDEDVFTTNQLNNGDLVSVKLTTSNICNTFFEVTSEPVLIEVNALQTPSLSISADQAASCDGSTILFTAEGEHLGSQPQFQWTVDGQPFGENSAIFSKADLENGQQVACLVRSSAECLTTVEAIANPLTARISQLQVQLLEIEHEHCGNAVGMLEVQALGGVEPYSLQWSNGATESYLTNLAAGTYQLLVTDANGCQADLSVEIEGSRIDIIRDVQIKQPTCQFPDGAATVYVKDIYDEHTFQWINQAGEVVAETAQADQLPGGLYQIVVINSGGCKESRMVEVESVQAASFELAGEIEIQLGKSAQLELQLLTHDAQIRWLPADGLSCSDCPNPVVEALTTTLYSVSVTSKSGCTTVKEVLVRVQPKQDVFIPNAFTPNGDGFNDYFTVYGGSHVAKVKSMQIFDRWGSAVFSKTHFDVNQETEGWNGQHRGKDLQQGVYVYVVEVQFIDGQTEHFRGDISITP